MFKLYEHQTGSISLLAHAYVTWMTCLAWQQRRAKAPSRISRCMHCCIGLLADCQGPRKWRRIAALGVKETVSERRLLSNQRMRPACVGLSLGQTM